MTPGADEAVSLISRNEMNMQVKNVLPGRLSAALNQGQSLRIQLSFEEAGNAPCASHCG